MIIRKKFEVNYAIILIILKGPSHEYQKYFLIYTLFFWIHIFDLYKKRYIMQRFYQLSNISYKIYIQRKRAEERKSLTLQLPVDESKDKYTRERPRRTLCRGRRIALNSKVTICVQIYLYSPLKSLSILCFIVSSRFSFAFILIAYEFTSIKYTYLNFD